MAPNVRPLGQSPAASRNRPTYVVKPGDSLGSIAARILGRADRWRELYNLNRGFIGASPDDLQVGTVLRLPATGPQAEPRRDSDGATA
jgi:nucleoid-associated protein YgaU